MTDQAPVLILPSDQITIGTTVSSPFAGVTLDDTSDPGIHTLIITVTGLAGTFSDGKGFTGLFASNPGTYSLVGTGAAITAELHALQFTTNTVTGANFETRFTLSALDANVTPIDKTIASSGATVPWNIAVVDASGAIIAYDGYDYEGSYYAYTTITRHIPGSLAAPQVIAAFDSGPGPYGSGVSGMLAMPDGTIIGITGYSPGDPHTPPTAPAILFELVPDPGVAAGYRMVTLNNNVSQANFTWLVGSQSELVARQQNGDLIVIRPDADPSDGYVATVIASQAPGSGLFTGNLVQDDAGNYFGVSAQGVAGGQIESSIFMLRPDPDAPHGYRLTTLLAITGTGLAALSEPPVITADGHVTGTIHGILDNGQAQSFDALLEPAQVTIDATVTTGNLAGAAALQASADVTHFSVKDYLNAIVPRLKTLATYTKLSAIQTIDNYTFRQSFSFADYKFLYRVLLLMPSNGHFTYDVDRVYVHGGWAARAELDPNVHSFVIIDTAEAIFARLKVLSTYTKISGTHLTDGGVVARTLGYGAYSAASKVFAHVYDSQLELTITNAPVATAARLQADNQVVAFSVKTGVRDLAAKLDSLVADTKLASIELTGKVNPTLTVTADQYLNDQAVLQRIVTPHHTRVVGAPGETLTALDRMVTLDGHLGNQTLNAADQGGDVLIGGPDDTLNGGAGRDTFVFRDHFGLVTVNAFAATGTAHDVLRIDHAIVPDWDHLVSAMSQHGDDLWIAANPHDMIILSGVTMGNLTHNDVVFI